MARHLIGLLLYMFSFSYFLLVNFDPSKGFIKADSKSTLTHFIMNGKTSDWSAVVYV